MNTQIINQTEMNNSSYSINLTDKLTGIEATEIRSKIENIMYQDCQTIYLDTRNVMNADLSGINEVIHTAYLFSNSSKELVIVYKKKSAMAKWIDATSLDRFIKTALIPSES